MKAILFALALSLVGVAAAEARVANDMTCAQAQSTYNRNGRIYVRTYSGDVVPIYGLRRSCGNQRRSPYFARTTEGSCFLGYRCYRR